MDIHRKYRAVKPIDLYDFYAISVLDRNQLNDIESKTIIKRLFEIKDIYMEALTSRFAHWAGKRKITINEMVGIMQRSLDSVVEEQASQMSRFGQGFNVLVAIQAMKGEQEKAKKEAEKVDIQNFSKKLGQFKAADYPKIAKGVINLHRAEDPKEIILAIDYLSDLQHCGGYILIDFVAGKRDPSNKFGNEMVKKILDIKKEVDSVLEFKDEMSKSILNIVEKQYSVKN